MFPLPEQIMNSTTQTNIFPRHHRTADASLQITDADLARLYIKGEKPGESLHALLNRHGLKGVKRIRISKAIRAEKARMLEEAAQTHSPEELNAAGAELERMCSTDTTEGSEHRS
jgi:hypothetical protein